MAVPCENAARGRAWGGARHVRTVLATRRRIRASPKSVFIGHLPQHTLHVPVVLLFPQAAGNDDGGEDAEEDDEADEDANIGPIVAENGAGHNGQPEPRS